MLTLKSKFSIDKADSIYLTNFNPMIQSILQKSLLIILLILLNSCATLLTRKNYNIKVTSNLDPAQIQINDSLYPLPTEFKIRRSKNDLHLKLISDTLTKDFTIKSSLNPTFLFANLLWVEFCPAAYLIDLTNQKRYYYGKSIYLNIYDTTAFLEPLLLKNFHSYFLKKYPTIKEQIYLTLGFPWINNFYLKPSQEPVKSNTGFWGFSAGVDYFYSNTRYFSLSFSFASDFFVPIPAAVDIKGEYEIMSSLYSSLTHNHRLDRFSLGYGINCASNIWDFNNTGDLVNQPSSRNPITKTSYSYGITTNLYYQFGKRFFTGIIYRPSILRIDPKLELKYEHLISLEFAWKIKLK